MAEREDTGRHLHALPPPPPERRSPWPKRATPPAFEDVPTAVRPLAQAAYRACSEELQRPWWWGPLLAIGVTLIAGGVSAALIFWRDSGSTDAVHQTQIESLQKDVEQVRSDVQGLDTKLDQVLREVRRR